MKHYAGLDVSLERTSVCVVDEQGRVVREGKVASEPEALAGWLTGLGLGLARVGLEAGPLSSWLHAGLRQAGLPVVCIETRHLAAALKAMRNKTDRNDARGIAQMLRTGWYRAVHVKSLASQEIRFLLVNRKLVLGKLVDVENGIRGSLRPFGLRLGVVRRRHFAGRVATLAAGQPLLEAVLAPLLAAHAAMLAAFVKLDGMMKRIAYADPVCQLLMTAPGVGPQVALTYRTGIDDPARFRHSRTVGPHLGLTPRRHESGETDYSGHVSKFGDILLRTALFEAANTLLCGRGSWSALKAWGLRIAKRGNMRRAKVAVARKLAVILHRMWTDGTAFRWTRAATVSA